MSPRTCQRYSRAKAVRCNVTSVPIEHLPLTSTLKLDVYHDSMLANQWGTIDTRISTPINAATSAQTDTPNTERRRRWADESLMATKHAIIPSVHITIASPTLATRFHDHAIDGPGAGGTAIHAIVSHPSNRSHNADVTATMVSSVHSCKLNISDMTLPLTWMQFELSA